LESAADIKERNSSGAIAEGGEMRRYTRLEAAQRQLEMAVRALLQFDDPISALTLAGAAERVLSDLQPSDGILGVDAWSIRAFCNTHIKQERQEAAAVLLRKTYNQLKHAQRSPSAVHDIHESEVLIWLLLSIRAFTALGGTATPILNTFNFWVMAARPDWISADDPELVKKFSEANRELGHLPKAKAFAALLEMVSSISQIPNP
jgi:hypothetical protein